MRSEPRVNGVEDDSALELDQLVAEEVAALRAPPTEPTVDALLDEVAERLKARPDREVLLEQDRDLAVPLDSCQRLDDDSLSHISPTCKGVESAGFRATRSAPPTARRCRGTPRSPPPARRAA